MALIHIIIFYINFVCILSDSIKMPKRFHDSGYKFDLFTVKTSDNYTLKHFKIYPRNLPGNGKVVVLGPGLGQSAEVFLRMGQEFSLAYHLANIGCEVWLLNFRGTSYSSGHTQLSINDSKFWEFSFYEMRMYDLPDSIDFILRKSKKSSLTFIGYSEAANAGFLMLSEKPEYNKKLTSMIAIAPLPFGCHETSGITKMLGFLEKWRLQTLISNNNNVKLLFFLTPPQKFLGLLANTWWIKNIFDFLEKLISNNDFSEKLFDGFIPDGVRQLLGSWQIAHIGQLISECNIRPYEPFSQGDLMPYSLKNITVDVYGIRPDRDDMCTPENFKILKNALPNGFERAYSINNTHSGIINSPEGSSDLNSIIDSIIQRRGMARKLLDGVRLPPKLNVHTKVSRRSNMLKGTSITLPETRGSNKNPYRNKLATPLITSRDVTSHSIIDSIIKNRDMATRVIQDVTTTPITSIRTQISSVSHGLDMLENASITLAKTQDLNNNSHENKVAMPLITSKDATSESTIKSSDVTTSEIESITTIPMTSTNTQIPPASRGSDMLENAIIMLPKTQKLNDTPLENKLATPLITSEDATSDSIIKSSDVITKDIEGITTSPMISMRTQVPLASLGQDMIEDSSTTLAKSQELNNTLLENKLATPPITNGDATSDSIIKSSDVITRDMEGITTSPMINMRTQIPSTSHASEVLEDTSILTLAKTQELNNTLLENKLATSLIISGDVTSDSIIDSIIKNSGMATRVIESATTTPMTNTRTLIPSATRDPNILEDGSIMLAKTQDLSNTSYESKVAKPLIRIRDTTSNAIIDSITTSSSVAKIVIDGVTTTMPIMYTQEPLTSRRPDWLKEEFIILPKNQGLNITPDEIKRAVPLITSKNATSGSIIYSIITSGGIATRVTEGVSTTTTTSIRTQMPPTSRRPDVIKGASITLAKIQELNNIPREKKLTTPQITSTEATRSRRRRTHKDLYC